MVDPSTLIPWINPLITAVAVFIKTQGTQKAGEKAAEILGEKVTEMTLNKGKKALLLLRNRFLTKADVKAQRALENVEHDPDNKDYQQKLVEEIAHLAIADPTFAQELRALTEKGNIAQSGSVIIENKAPSNGAQGIFNAPVQFYNRVTKDTP